MLAFRSLRQYQVWRSFDRQIWTPNKFVGAAAFLKASPLRMVKVFGPPDTNTDIAGASGVYDFEDDNFDFFRVHDVREVIDVSPEGQQRRKHPPKNLRYKPMPLPSIEDFWNSAEVVSFRVTAPQHANVDEFLKWAKKVIAADQDIKKVVLEKFGPIRGANRYEETYPLETEFAYFKYNAQTWDVPAEKTQKGKKDKSLKPKDEDKKPKDKSKSPDKKPAKKPEAEVRAAADPLKVEN